MRELRFMSEGKELLAIDFGTLVMGGSSNYPGLYISLDGTIKNFKERSPRDIEILQMTDGKWIPVEFDELRFYTINPKDDQPTGVNVIPCILSSENPLTIDRFPAVHFNSFFGGPKSFSSCDGWKPLKDMTIFQLIDDGWYKIYPEWNDNPYFEAAADKMYPVLGTTTSNTLRE